MIRLALVLATWLAGGAAHAVDDPYPWIAAAYLVKRDGTVLWAGQPDARLALIDSAIDAVACDRHGRLSASFSVCPVSS